MDIDKITDDIIKNPVFIREESDKKIRWVKIPWVTRCAGFILERAGKHLLQHDREQILTGFDIPCVLPGE